MGNKVQIKKCSRCGESVWRAEETRSGLCVWCIGDEEDDRPNHDPDIDVMYDGN